MIMASGLTVTKSRGQRLERLGQNEIDYKLEFRTVYMPLNLNVY